jgi:probable HAF family extracellular repeat protein
LAQCLDFHVDVVSLPYCGFGGYGISPGGLSSNGDVTGWYSVCETDAGAFYWTGGALTLFDVGEDAIGGGLDVNSQIQIVGVKNGPTGHVGFLYENGKTIDIGMLPGSNFAEAHAINESGQIVGESSDVVNGPLGAFFWDNGKQFALDLSQGPNSIAQDINDAGQVVGWMGQSPISTAYAEAFLWENGKTTPLGIPPPGVSSEAKAISHNGYVCGVYAYPNPNGGVSIRRAFRWSEGVMTELGILSGYLRSVALDVNNEGIVVGYCSNNLPSHAFIWKYGVMHDLNDFIAPELDLELTQGVAINNNGQILCAAFNETNSFVAVLLTPIPSSIGDFNCDATVNVDDLLGVINNWAKTPPQGSKWFPPGDFDHDGIVELDDLMIVIDNWGL